MDTLLCGNVILQSSLEDWTKQPQVFTESLIQHGVSNLFRVAVVPFPYTSGCQRSFHNLLVRIELRTLAVKCGQGHLSSVGEKHILRRSLF